VFVVLALDETTCSPCEADGLQRQDPDRGTGTGERAMTRGGFRLLDPLLSDLTPRHVEIFWRYQVVRTAVDFTAAACFLVGSSASSSLPPRWRPTGFFWSGRCCSPSSPRSIWCDHFTCAGCRQADKPLRGRPGEARSCRHRPVVATGQRPDRVTGAGATVVSRVTLLLSRAPIARPPALSSSSGRGRGTAPDGFDAQSRANAHAAARQGSAGLRYLARLRRSGAALSAVEEASRVPQLSLPRVPVVAGLTCAVRYLVGGGQARPGGLV